MKNLVGEKYGRLRVMGLEYTRGYNSYWRCKCKCGKETVVARVNLGRKTNSCGCLRKEVLSRGIDTRELSIRCPICRKQHSPTWRGKRKCLREAMKKVLSSKRKPKLQEWPGILTEMGLDLSGFKFPTTAIARILTGLKGKKK